MRVSLPVTPIHRALRLLCIVLLLPLYAWPVVTGASVANVANVPTEGSVHRAKETTVAARDRDIQLWQLVADRLSWMPAVARWKQIHGRPIEDLSREAQVLQASTERGKALGLPAGEIEGFMQLQMDLAKHIQVHTLHNDATHADNTDDDADTRPVPPDLVHVIRPALNQVGTALLLQIALFRADINPPPPQIIEQLKQLGLQQRQIDQLSQSLQALRAAPAHQDNDRLHLIKARGVLRVGSTGDYAPFSLRTSDEANPAYWQGIDLDLAENLAAALQVKLMIIPTSWPDLLADLQADRFDIAMSGISRRLFRAEAGYFSNAYHIGGKTPIIRCRDAKKYATVSQIDQPGVRVIVNPGGTNERFTRATIKNASILMFADNRDIFQQIVAGEADVMFTDAIEVRLQTRRQPTLCAALARPLNYQSKGILIQRDNHLLHYVNLWLEELKGSGTLQNVFARHLSNE